MKLHTYFDRRCTLSTLALAPAASCALPLLSYPLLCCLRSPSQHIRGGKGQHLAVNRQ